MRALITGVLGQDGWYLSELLLSKGYEVIGTRRGNEEPVETPKGVHVVYGDITDACCIRMLAEEYKPDEFYNLAAVTHVGDSFSAAANYFHINAIGAANCIDAADRIGAKFYQASTSELFGDSPPPQNESTPMRPRSPYAVAKLAAYWLTRNYRERGLHAVNGILFNHESPRRGAGFVTQKIAKAVADIIKGKTDHVVLGNLESKRDWGHAKDFVRGMWMMMQEPPDDYVLATGQSRSIRELCEVAFGHVGLDYTDHVRTSDEFKRPLEVNSLLGDPSKARSIGWEPKIGFKEMICEMVDAAMQRP